MPDKNSILKNPKLRPDEDYNYLRDKGRQYIEELGSAFWTDYNEHDPGITILEALCYAITELGYRTSFPIEDLLTGSDGTIPASQTFFTAKNILTQSPLSIDDYRKLLIDIDGVKNAWLFAHSHYKDENTITPAGEIALFADSKNNELTFTDSTTSITPPVYLKGLYKALLDLDDDPQLGDLNNAEIDVPINLPTGPAELNIVFDGWEKADPVLFTIIVNPTDTNNPNALIKIVAQPDFNPIDSTITISFQFNNTPYTILGKVVLGLQPAGSTVQVSTLFTQSFSQQILYLYLAKIIKTHSIIQAATAKLNCHRNLCEDFVTVEIVQDEPIAFCFDIDIIPSADMEEVEANIFFTIEQYLNPDVKFYLLGEMLQKGNTATNTIYTTDEIFDGPKLKHGFIDTTELENTNLRTEIYASEIISQIMNIKINEENVVLAVRNFRMTAYDTDGSAISMQANQQWCINVKNWNKPILSKDKSKITIYKNQIPFLAREKETDETLQWLESLHTREKLISTSGDIAIPAGTYFPLETYTSIQDIFPQTYGIGDAALPLTATDERRAQARQLKAYLLFYDQLLADFFMQLKNAEKLFSTDTIIQTYYAQFVKGFKDYDSIYIKDDSNGKYLIEENVLDLPAAQGWQDLYETSKTFTDRRNRFLDHLMARFAESFNEYVFMMYSLDSVTQDETAIEPLDLIGSKEALLSNYPRISYNRAKAYDYCPLQADFTIDTSKLWNTDNVSGLEEKLCLLGGFANPANGMKNYYRRFLHSVGYKGDIILAVQAVSSGSPIQYNFSLTLNQSISNPAAITLTSINYATLALLNIDLTWLINNIGIAEFPYNTILTTPGTGNIATITVNGNILPNNSFDNDSVATIAMANFVAEFETSSSSPNEGLHLLEHILLRPRDNTYLLAPVCLDDCESCSEDDPYSFRISIVLPVLPSWTGRFNNMDFRDYFEKIAREEAPAHCMVKICWINLDAMLQFEICYNTWIQAMTAYYSNKTENNETFLADANNNLIIVLYSLYSEYPPATLHNCDVESDTNPVMLGKTVLGTFNK